MTVLVAFSSSLSFATETTYEQHVARGVLQIEEKNYREAISEFSAALNDQPGDFTATLYLGIAQSRSGDREAEATLKKALAMKPGDTRATLELGIYYYNTTDYKASVGYFDRVIAGSPNSDLLGVTKEYLRAATLQGSAKPWSLNISVGGQYDSNVVLNGSDSPLPRGISRESDWRAVIYLAGKYDFLKTDRAQASVAYSLYQNLHAKLTDFNVSDHLGTLSASYALTPLLGVRANATLEYSFVGGNDYDSAYSLSPVLVVSEGNGYSTEMEYVYKKSRFMNSDLFTGNADRSGSKNILTITQNIPLSPTVFARVSYAHDVDSTRKEFWSYRGNKIYGALQIALPRTCFLDLSAEYYKRDYKGAFQVPGNNRRDNEYAGSVSITKVLSPRFSVTVGEYLARNDSNTAVFDYKRAITSLFLNARF